MIKNIFNTFWTPRTFNIADLKSPTIRKINSFSELEAGWCYGRGEKFTDDILEEAVDLIKHINALSFYETDAFPSESNEVLITIYKDSYFSEILVRGSGRYNFTLENNDTEIIESEDIDYNALVSSLREFRDEVSCNPSEYSTQCTTILAKKDTQVLPLRTPVAAGGYLSSPRSVQAKQLDAFAHTLHNTTPPFRVNPLYSCA